MSNKLKELKDNLKEASTDEEFVDKLTEFFYDHQRESFEEYEKENRKPEYK